MTQQPTHQTHAVKEPAADEKKIDTPKPATAPTPTVADALAQLDKNIIDAGNPGPPGSGLYTLLETCANQFMGVPRSPFPPPVPAPMPSSGTTTAPPLSSGPAMRA
jgi:hypothetical protein